MAKMRMCLNAAILIFCFGQARAQMTLRAPAAGLQAGITPSPAVNFGAASLAPAGQELLSPISLPDLAEGMRESFTAPASPDVRMSAAQAASAEAAVAEPSALPSAAHQGPRAYAGADADDDARNAENGSSVREGLTQAAQNLGEWTQGNIGFGAMKSAAGRPFDGSALNSVAGGFDLNAAGFADAGQPVDSRINSAIGTLRTSEIGTQMWTYIFDNHKDLRYRVDPNPSADHYTVRLVDNPGEKVIWMTEKFLSSWPAKAAGAAIVREWSKLFFGAVPVSAELTHLTYSHMLRAFAEMTGSGIRGWWNHNNDHRQANGSSAIHNLYSSWKDAVRFAFDGGDARNTPWFSFLLNSDASNPDARAKSSLYQQYRTGRLSWRDYQTYNNYFLQIVRGEQDWIGNSGRW